jgi:hypothetical protein
MLGSLSSVPSAANNLLSSLGVGADVFKNIGTGLGNFFNSGSGISYAADGSVINSTVPTDYGTTTGADPGYSDLY